MAQLAPVHDALRIRRLPHKVLLNNIIRKPWKYNTSSSSNSSSKSGGHLVHEFQAANDPTEVLRLWAKHVTGVLGDKFVELTPVSAVETSPAFPSISAFALKAAVDVKNWSLLASILSTVEGHRLLR